MDKKYYFKKEFKYDISGTLMLPSYKQIDEYNDNVFIKLQNYRSTKELKELMLKMYSDFFEIYKYDKKTATYPNLIGEFPNKDKKEEYISNYIKLFDFYSYSGNILCSYQEFLFKNEKDKVIRLNPIRFISGIRFDELYNLALNDYASTLLGINVPDPLNILHKQPPRLVDTYIDIVNYRGIEGLEIPKLVDKPFYVGEHAYVAALLLPILIERNLMIKSYGRVVKKGLRVISKKLDDDKLKLSEEEKALFDSLNTIKNGIYPFDYRPKLYSLLVKYGDVEDNNDNKSLVYQELFDDNSGESRSKLTMGDLLNNKTFKEMLEPTYFKVINYIFSGDGLNMRNNVAHLNNTNYDYLALPLTSILMQSFWDVAKDIVFKEE